MPARLALFFIVFVYSVFRAQNFDTICLQQRHVLNTIASQHFSPPIYNVVTNSEVLELFLKEADERSILFMEADRAALLQTIISSPGADIHCLLIRQAYGIVEKRLPQLDSIIRITEKKKIEFSARDTINFTYGKKDRVFCRNMQELSRRIEKRIKYECLVELTSPGVNLKELTDPEYGEVKKFAEKARQKSLKRLRTHLRDFKNEKFLVDHLGDCMSNAISMRSDPHTNYFNSRDLHNYQSALFMDESSFGFSVTEDDNGNILISGLVPGGPAWKSNSLNEKDVILSFRFENEEEVAVENTGLDDFYRDFYKSASQVVELKVRKKDLKIKTVQLKKEKIQSQEHMLNSYVISVDNKKFGYIPIPSFYLNEEADSRQGLANDVAKEIIELKLDTISGLILDLRYNGGGSMREAMGLAGIFIDEGPVAIYKPRNGNPFLLKDLNRGLIWDGPLVVLVNSASASASEFVTATLQDYNRAIVVGSTTFGKGTAQSVLMADSSYYAQEVQKQQTSNFGFLKVTSGKFYRVSSESHQGKGIEPDIRIPGIIEKVMEKESAASYFLPADVVDKKAEFNALQPLPKDSLRIRSERRMSMDPRFNEIAAIGDSLQRNRFRTEKIALTLRDFNSYSEKQRRFSNHIDGLFTAVEPMQFQISDNSQNSRIAAMSEYARKNHESTIETLKKDLVLHESINILNDLAAFSTKTEQ
jgi:carboxyl-terminal processing protease